MPIVDFNNVDLLDGFWNDRYKLNITNSIPNIIKRFESTRLAALRFTFNEKNNLSHRYYDSDSFKLIEAIAYVLLKNRNDYKDLESLCDDLILNIKNHQLENGYFNSYYQLNFKELAFSKRGDHELYNLGHLIEASIAYDKATNKKDLLEVAFKYIDYVILRFVKNKDTKFVTPGHEEIELALLKLYEYTSNKKYYDLATFFLEARANNKLDTYEEFANNRYAQDNETIRNLKSVEGHAVRAMYLYDAMSKYALINNDYKVIKALKALYNDLLTKQYITGSIGSYRIGEIFTIPYDLNNLTAYSESCASIGEMMFMLDLYAITLNHKIHDQIERILYNGFLSSTSLDGKAFFYENPLEIRRKEINKETSLIDIWRQKLPITKRVELFECSCCPPNIARFVASIAKYIYFTKDKDIYINQFISSKTTINNTNIIMNSMYPYDFKINLKINCIEKQIIKVRIPKYAKEIIVNGLTFSKEKGYLVFCLNKGESNIDIEFITTPLLISANPLNVSDANKVCLINGPIVYCLEEIDNGSDLNSLFIKDLKNISKEYKKEYGMNIFKVEGYRKLNSNKPYAKSYKLIKQELVFIPYYTFANRDETDMLVWVNKK